MRRRAGVQRVAIMVSGHDCCCLCLQDCGERGCVCVACDRAFCPFCIVIVTGEILCRPCAEEESEP